MTPHAKQYHSCGWWLAAVWLGTSLSLSGCFKSDHVYYYEGREALLKIQPEKKRPAAAGRRNEVFLVGAVAPVTSDAEPVSDEIKIGSFVGPWALTSIVWLDDRTVAVCPLAADPMAKTQVNLLVTPQTRGIFHIVTHCSP